MTFNCGAFFAAPVTAAVFEAACARQSISRNISSMCVCLLVGLNGINSMFGVSRQQRNFKMITKHRVQHGSATVAVVTAVIVHFYFLNA